MLEQALMDIRNKAIEQAKEFGTLSPYNISCLTLISILDELDVALSCDYTDCNEHVTHVTCDKHHYDEIS